MKPKRTFEAVAGNLVLKRSQLQEHPTVPAATSQVLRAVRQERIASLGAIRLRAARPGTGLSIPQIIVDVFSVCLRLEKIRCGRVLPAALPERYTDSHCTIKIRALLFPFTRVHCSYSNTQCVRTTQQRGSPVSPTFA